MLEISLKEFLNVPQTGLKLEFAAYQAGVFAGSKPLMPFEVDESGLMTRLMGGKMQASGLLTARPVIFLISRDTYPDIIRVARPLANPDIESLWQANFAIRRHMLSLNILSCQVDPDGVLLPFQPLFLCRHARRFFSPPCPRCGKALSLCRDDGFLVANGLKPYTTSLQRYLYCPECTQNSPVFFSAEPDSGSSALGPGQLFLELGKLTAGDIPCAGCDQAVDCYGSERQVLNRLAVVSFYPFHMLIFDAAALNALDFLQLAEGDLLAMAEKTSAKPAAEMPAEQSTTPTEGIPVLPKKDDENIRAIIDSIRLRWEQSARDQVRTGSGEPLSVQDHEQKPAGGVGTSETVVFKTTEPLPEKEEDDFHTQTIIVRNVPPVEKPPAGQDSLEQAVLLRPEAPPAQDIAFSPADDPEATIVIAPRVPAPDIPQSTIPEKASTPPNAHVQPENDLMATVTTSHPSKPAQPVNSDDELAETVILKPKK